MDHIIVVTAIPNDERDDYDWHLDSDTTHGVGCQVWRECQKAWHQYTRSAWRWTVPISTCGSRASPRVLRPPRHQHPIPSKEPDYG